MKPEDFDDLKQLVEFLKQNQVAEFDLDRGNVKIRLKFEPPAAPAVTPVLAALAPIASVPAAAPYVAPAAPASPAVDDSLHLIKSLMVGTFYSSPSPGAAPFVSPGDRVQKGQVVCVIEAMKLMNEIEADADGEIVKCLVTNGQPIEFGQPLFSLRT
jgi:acetyl-CoA carboxylase biotin carboxyl carrier protein